MSPTFGGADWPADYSTGEIYGQILDYGTGAPFSQELINRVPQIVFTPRPVAVSDTDAGVIMFSAPITVLLDGTGSFDVALPATDDPNISPIDWTYEVQEGWPGGRTYDIEVPSGVRQNLAAIAPVDTSTGVARFAGPPGPPGPAITTFTLDADNNLVLTLADDTTITGPQLLTGVIDGGNATSAFTATIDGGGA